ncbi:Protein of unknown function [Anaerobranca californiensis DSM 14826]|jgi:hypothetical protein|uniref:DUF2508 domain-containing protein n=1 Tax=Anaerobranca californiensis DSM 14826 TaxID=1120989 RepID=A0A1M6R6J1_9FIRM|nr:DUF2508 family protein [Anaerobranca californiensis]SHK27968.1 Protein of unknown function [Anaerobranca californiensis DSM 14826]
MLDKITNILIKIKNYFENEQPIISEQSKSIMELVEEAKREWLAAKEYFENVSDPDLIDYAIHSIKATEKRYNYLLKKVKQMNLEEIK